MLPSPAIDRILVCFLLVALLCSCSREKVENPIVHVLNTSQEKAIRSVMEQLNTYEVQIHFTQIERINGSIKFSDHTFQEVDSNYFYPASTVKFPVAVLALEKLSTSENIDLNTRFYVEGDTVETTFADEIVKVFAVSDNDANNRLFEFLGQDWINRGLRTKGIGPVRIAHRLSTDDADDVTTKPLILYLNDSTTTAFEGSINSPHKLLSINGITKGTGYIMEDSLIQEPFDFSFKNYYPIHSQQEVLKRVIFPANYKKSDQFVLGDKERGLLLKSMSLPPRAWGYNPDEYYDSYGKFFIYGDSKSPIPDHISIFNKVGYAYGTLTDCAYVIDNKNDIEFLLTATILVNRNGIFNDDTYEFDEIGIPFLAALGRELYQFEKERN